MLVDFIVLEMAKGDPRMNDELPLIYRRIFMATVRTGINVRKGTLKMKVLG